MFRKQEKTSYVMSMLESTVKYDGTVCDGYCLMEDIQIILDSEEAAQ